MRLAGKFDDDKLAEAFRDCPAEGIESRMERGRDGAWEIWALNDDRREDVRALFRAFSRNPSAPEFTAARGAARKADAKRKAEYRDYHRRFIDIKTSWRERLVAGDAPVTICLIALSVVITVILNIEKGMEFADQYLFFTKIGSVTQPGFWDPALPEMKSGELWRLFTPMFMHFGILHILFNMLWLRDLGGAVERVFGKLTLLSIVLVTEMTSSTAEYLWSGPYFGGMSGVVYGLFGYIWIRGKLDPTAGTRMPKSTAILMIGWLFLCMTGVVGVIANAAHAAGLAVGMLLGWASSARDRAQLPRHGATAALSVILPAAAILALLAVKPLPLREGNLSAGGFNIEKYYTGPEALEWLKSNKNPSALASNRFLGTDNAVRFVEKLYAAGAEKVLISAACIHDDKEVVKEEGGPYADGLVVILPGDAKKRAALQDICSQEIAKEGFDPEESIKGDKVFLWWD